MAVWGFRRGLLSGLIGTAKYAVGVPVSLFVSHQYYQAVYDNLGVAKALAKVQEKIAGSLRRRHLYGCLAGENAGSAPGVARGF